MKKKATEKTGRSIGGALFGLIFVCVGIFAAYISTSAMIVGSIKSSNWVQVPVTIQSLELDRKYGDTTTYRVKGKYSYRFNGVEYQSSSVAPGNRYDNIGTYWQDLYRTLGNARSNNNATALVNPNNATESFLDSTFRWKTLVFGFMFLFLFSGMGSFVMWLSLTPKKSREERLVEEKSGGITSNQKTGGWFFVAFGSVFFVMGGGMGVAVLPDAIADKEYGALALLLFVAVGLGIMTYGYKMQRAYKRFGPTPLFLDPASPSVGGQLGGHFSISVPGNVRLTGSSTKLRATLSCVRTHHSNSKNGSSSYTTLWREDVPVFLEQTASGVTGKFIVDIPADAEPSRGIIRRTSISWNVEIKGDFTDAGLGEFGRDWLVVVEEKTDEVSSSLSIPQSFLQAEAEISLAKAEESVFQQVQVVEDYDSITITNKAGRYIGSAIFGVLFGAVFTGIGVYTVGQDWFPGYIFQAVGGLVIVISIFSAGKSVVVSIDKPSRTLRTKESWCGMKYANKKGEIIDPNQFSIKKTSSSGQQGAMKDYYAVNFKSNGKEIRIAQGIEGKREAKALKDSLIERLFDQRFRIAA